MKSIKLKTKFSEFSLDQMPQQDSVVIIPTIKDTFKMNYGAHAYYFLNFKTSKGICIEISHKEIIEPGFTRFIQANYIKHKKFPVLKSLFQKYHFGFNFIEQIMLLTVPHTVTELGNGRYIINLWAYFGYLEVDCKNKLVTYHINEEAESNNVFGSQQIYMSDTKDRYYMKYSLDDSLKKSLDPFQKVHSRIVKYNEELNQTTEIWKEDFVDYLHDIIINKNKQYLVACELGMFVDENNELINSKVLVIDLINNKQWTISQFKVAAHAQFDPDDPNIVYFSNHNFQFEHSNIVKLVINANYTLKFRGPASIYKYQLTPEGPKEIGVYTSPDLFRLTNFHVFKHKGNNLIAAMGAPNFIFILEAENLQLIKIIELKEKKHFRDLYQNIPCYIGTFSPSLDGEKLYIQTQKSFQIIDIDSCKQEFIRSYSFNHSCSNHMLVSRDTTSL
ncbi:MAG: hypothetical protein AB1782_14080 [Cyanobacteriota bacterium]